MDPDPDSGLTLSRGSFALAASTADLDEEPRAREDADLVEFRMDLAEEPLPALAGYDGELPVLATNRATWEGGEATDGSRLDDLVAAAGHDAVVAVDVELDSARERAGQRAIAEARGRGVDVVVSSHDFEGAPERAEMRERLVAAGEHGDVAKLAVTASDRADVLDLLAVTRARDAAGDAVATMAMGEAGRHSRAVAPLYGSRIGYAPVDAAEATAPGQYDLGTLRHLVETLRGPQD